MYISDLSQVITADQCSLWGLHALMYTDTHTLITVEVQMRINTVAML